MPFSPVETAPPASTYTLRVSTGSVTGAASVSSGCGRSSWPVPASPPGAVPSPAALPVPLAPPEPTWTCTLTLDKDEPYTFEYYGPLAFYNRTLDGNMSNLTEDVELHFTQGMAIYYGDIYEMGSDAWNVLLAEADYDLNVNYGPGDAVQLAFNVTNGAGDYIPDGEYTLLDANTAEELPAGTMLAGMYDPSYGGYWGCWFYSVRRLVEARLDSGTVTVSRTGEIYTLKLQLKDGAGRNVTSTYTGKLDHYTDLE